MSNRIYVTLDGRAATDDEMEMLMINYFPGRSEADIDVLHPNGKTIDGHSYGFRFQTDGERNLLEALISARDHLRETLNDPRIHPIGKCPTLDRIEAVIAKATGTA